ncbi:hypothetical protein FHW12_000298 [Dokdonella fugitiva]|uniref:ASCH domain-containing protein n=1 Tax=Dokdonella fugitiva TaxID=328517 RepID=A0A839EP87_9GAMM|nr:hypothetical protein [Dokdonella fugitiva]MBA8886107.1 hypothetical protein [Dokdonella fugitiva]
MRERPILMSAPMVRAILAGTKSQTRRAVKLPHAHPLGEWEPTTFGGTDARGIEHDEQAAIWHTRTGETFGCPYGVPGDSLWVRETWTWTGGSLNHPHDAPLPAGAYDELSVRYAADGAKRTIETGGRVLPVPKQPPRRDGEVYSLRDAPADFVYTGDNTYMDRLDRWWKRKIPGIHMPRWASRITLEVTDVRVERLQAISEADAWAEGVEHGVDHLPDQAIYAAARRLGTTFEDARPSFVALWESINGACSWDANPWVWVVSFKRIEA